MRDMIEMQCKLLEARARAAIFRPIWTAVILVGLATLNLQLLETCR